MTEAEFLTWARETLPGLRGEPSAAVADLVGEQLLLVHEHLGVEVADDREGADSREIIITAFSEPSLFEVVRRVAERLSGIPGWRVVALKQPRGFAFHLTVGKQRLRAGDLLFSPLHDVEAGVALFTPRGIAPPSDDTEELGWLIVETGIGEELTGRIQHIEFGTAANAQGAKPISGLAQWVSSLPTR